MNLLALDTSSIACSVALKVGERVFERHEIQPREHTRLLLPMIEAILKEGGVELRALRAIVAGNGPGSFIGMRIAASVAQGLCYAAGLKMVPVSSLVAVAAEALRATSAERVAVAQDAHMNQVYLAFFSRGDDGLPVAEGAPFLQPIARIVRLDEYAAAGTDAAHVHAAGAGWQRYPELLSLNADRLAGPPTVELPRARYLLDPGEKSYRAGEAIDPAELEPAYVRADVAG